MDNGGDKKSLEELENRLNEARGAQQPGADSGQRGNAPGKSLGVAFRLTVELVVGIAVGVGIGWTLDQWLETSPVFFVIFFLLGAAAGMLNVMRAAREMGLSGEADEPDKNE